MKNWTLGQKFLLGLVVLVVVILLGMLALCLLPPVMDQQQIASLGLINALGGK